jgi:tRNA (guanine37-N1)-methyltransferase
MDKVKAIKVAKDKAQEIINVLRDNNNLNSDYKIQRIDNYIIIPIKEAKEGIKKYDIIEIEGKEHKGNLKSLRDILKEKKLSEEIISKIPSSYDIVGDIIITNIDPSIVRKYKKKIGESYLDIHPHVKVVLNKKKEHHGVFRTQDLSYVYGEKRKETIIKENGCIFKTNVEKVFYSTRLSTERQRIVSLVKLGERVGVFFAGVGPFAITIAKNARPKEVVAIELNPVGVKYLKENIKLNKVEDKVIPVLGDVKRLSKKYCDYFDRIPMPLPKSAELFLDSAIYSIKSRGVIHIYSFVAKDDPYAELENILKQKEKEKNVKLKIIEKRIIRSFSPTTVQVVLDIKVNKTKAKQKTKN